MTNAKLAFKELEKRFIDNSVKHSIEEKWIKVRPYMPTKEDFINKARVF